MPWRKALYALAFCVLAAAAALSVNRAVDPDIPLPLLLAAGLGFVAGLPGLIHNRAAFASMLLLPLGAYLLVRVMAPLPHDAHGWSGQWDYYILQLRYGLIAYRDEYFPLSLTGVPGLALLVVLSVYLVTSFASLVGLGAGRPLLGVGSLLGLLGFCFTVDEHRSNVWVAIGLLFLAVVALLASHALSRGKWGLRDTAAGLAIGGVSLLIAAAFLGVAPGFTAARGWEDWHQWDPFQSGRVHGYVFNWKQNYPRLLDPGQDFPIMKVTSKVPSYWRANVLEDFTGDSWIASGYAEQLIPAGTGTRTLPDMNEPGTASGTTTREHFEIRSLYTSYLFTGGVPLSLRLTEPVGVFESDAGSLRAERILGPTLTYDVVAAVPHVSPQQLVGLGQAYPKSVGTYVELPLPTAARIRTAQAAGEDWRKMVMDSTPRGAEFVGLYALNSKIVGDATDPYQIVLRIEEYLRKNYRYSLSPPKSALHSPYAAFLLDTHVGYCQHFSGAMALLLRLNGIPSRVDVGFITGKPLGNNVYQVSSNNAHAWDEVYFPGFGWLPFDPTPGNGLPTAGASSTSPGFLDPFGHDQSTTAVAGPSQNDNGGLPPEGLGATGASSSKVAAHAGSFPWFWIPASIAAIVLLLPPARLRLRRRRARQGSASDRLRGSFQLVLCDLRDWGLAVPDSLTWEEVAVLVAGETQLDAGPLFRKGQAVFFGGRGADLEDVRGAEEFRGRLRRCLRAKRGWARSVLAWYGLGGSLQWSFGGAVRTGSWPHGRRALAAGE